MEVNLEAGVERVSRQLNEMIDSIENQGGDRYYYDNFLYKTKDRMTQLFERFHEEFHPAALRPRIEVQVLPLSAWKIAIWKNVPKQSIPVLPSHIGVGPGDFDKIVKLLRRHNERITRANSDYNWLVSVRYDRITAHITRKTKEALAYFNNAFESSADFASVFSKDIQSFKSSLHEQGSAMIWNDFVRMMMVLVELYEMRLDSESFGKFIEGPQVQGRTLPTIKAEIPAPFQLEKDEMALLSAMSDSNDRLYHIKRSAELFSTLAIVGPGWHGEFAALFTFLWDGNRFFEEFSETHIAPPVKKGRSLIGESKPALTWIIESYFSGNWISRQRTLSLIKAWSYFAFDKWASENVEDARKIWEDPGFSRRKMFVIRAHNLHSMLLSYHNLIEDVTSSLTDSIDLTIEEFEFGFDQDSVKELDRSDIERADRERKITLEKLNILRASLIYLANGSGVNIRAGEVISVTGPRLSVPEDVRSSLQSWIIEKLGRLKDVEARIESLLSEFDKPPASVIESEPRTQSWMRGWDDKWTRSIMKLSSDYMGAAWRSMLTTVSMMGSPEYKTIFW